MDALAFLRRFATVVAVLLALDAFLQSAIPLVRTSSVVVPPFAVVGQTVAQASLWLLAAAVLALVSLTSSSAASARRWGQVMTGVAGVAVLLAAAAVLTGRQATGVIPAPALRLVVQAAVSALALAVGCWVVGRVLRGIAEADA